MPELPEVEVIRRGLELLIVDRLFARPELIFPAAVRYPEAEVFCHDLYGRRVIAISRRGKYLMLELDRGVLVVHLRMTGRLVYFKQREATKKDLRVVMPFSDGSLLYFSDTRKFGGLWLLDSSSDLSLAGMHRLGPDIYDQLTREQFIAKLQQKPRAGLKSLLLNQSFVAGLGNIYVDESLYRCKIHPCRNAGSLTREEETNLFQAIRDVLDEGIHYGGASFRDYKDATGKQGQFQERFAVYGRKGSLCFCGAPIERIKVAGRGTHYCPQCQTYSSRK